MRSLFFVLLAGCASDPQDALDAYAEALRAKDAEQVWLLSDESFQQAFDRGAIEAHLRAHPEEIDRLLEAIAGADRVHATIMLGDGRRLELVKEPSGWRVAYGGLELFDAGTPEAALIAFFRAAEAKRLDALRSLMPDRAAKSFADDAALDAHLSVLHPRIEAAKKSLPPIRPNLAEIEGDRAWIAYGAGKRVELIKEQDRWRVVDLE